MSDVGSDVLQRNRRPAPKLPLDVLSDRWAQWVEDAAHGAPPDYLVASLLASASALIGHARWVKAWHGWQEPPHLWCAKVGDSRDGNSAGAYTLYQYILPVIEHRMTAGFPDQLREARVEIEAARIRVEKWKKEMMTAIKAGRSLPQYPGPVPQEPMAPLLMLTDVTIERLAFLLTSGAPKGVLMTRDDLGRWLLGTDAYKEAARAFWIEAWWGRRYILERLKSSEPLIIPRLAVSLDGEIQSTCISEVMQDADEALLARFMWFWPDPVPFKTPKRRPAIDWAIAALDRLRTLDLAASKHGPTPLVVPLDDAAAGQLERFVWLMHERKEKSTGMMRSAIGKARGLVLRLSLVLEYLRWCEEDGHGTPPDTIGEDIVIAAIKFVGEYALPMAERAYGEATRLEADDATTP